MIERRSNEINYHEIVNVGGREGYRLTGEDAVFKIGEEIEKGRKLGAPTFQAVYRRSVGKDYEVLTKYKPDGTRIDIHHKYGSSKGIYYFQDHQIYREEDVVRMPSPVCIHEYGLTSEIVVVPSFGGERKDYLPNSSVAEDFAKLEASCMV